MNTIGDGQVLPTQVPTPRGILCHLEAACAGRGASSRSGSTRKPSSEKREPYYELRRACCCRSFDSAHRPCICDQRCQIIELGKDGNDSARQSLLLKVYIVVRCHHKNRQFRNEGFEPLSQL